MYIDKNVFSSQTTYYEIFIYFVSIKTIGH